MALKTKQQPLCVILTGISGAGRSQAIKCLEDFEFFCVDNLPSPLLPQFAKFIRYSGKETQRVALGIDVRDRNFLADLPGALETFQQTGIRPWVVFLDADDATLLRRFSETRRRHPLGSGGILDGIRKERQLLRETRARANRVIDTSHLTLSELKEEIAQALPMAVARTLNVSICSFGFKYGAPTDADVMMDVRFLPNPNYVPQLHKKTGIQKSVQNYVLQERSGQIFLKQFSQLIYNNLKYYVREGKSHLTIAIGCTGGRHRSVTIAEKLSQFLRKKGYPVSVRHRDTDRPQR